MRSRAGRRRETIEQGRLPCLRAAGHEDVEPRRHGSLEEARRLPGEGAQPDEVVHRVGLDHELAHVDVPVVAGDVGDDDVQPDAVREHGIDEGRAEVDPSPRRLQHALDEVAHLVVRQQGGGELSDAVAGHEHLATAR